jgi:hypothetical protein
LRLVVRYVGGQGPWSYGVPDLPSGRKRRQPVVMTQPQTKVEKLGLQVTESRTIQEETSPPMRTATNHAVAECGGGWGGDGWGGGREGRGRGVDGGGAFVGVLPGLICSTG